MLIHHHFLSKGIPYSSSYMVSINHNFGWDEIGFDRERNEAKYIQKKKMSVAVISHVMGDVAVKWS